MRPAGEVEDRGKKGETKRLRSSSTLAMPCLMTAGHVACLLSLPLGQHSEGPLGEVSLPNSYFQERVPMTMLLPLTITNSIAIAALTATSIGGHIVATPDNMHYLRVASKTDILSTVPQNKIRVIQNSQERTFLTDAAGVTPSFTIAQEDPVELFLKQKNTAAGVCLGQAFTFISPELNTGNDVFNILTTFQPVLEPVVLTSSDTHVTQAGSHSRWAFFHDEDASFTFPANVGILMTPREIDGIEDYYDLEFAHDDYRMGLVIKVGDPEELGDRGALVQLCFDSYGFTDIPGADLYFVASAAADLGVADFRLTPRSWHTTTERAVYGLTDTLGKGMNILLFRDGGFEDVAEMLAQPPVFLPIAQQATQNLQVEECEPPAAGGGVGSDSCTTPAIPDDGGCANSGCSAGGGECSASWMKVGPRVCTGGGGTTAGTNMTVTNTITGGVSTTLSVQGAGVTLSEGASTSVSQSVDFGNLNDGAHGCGMCGQAYQKIVVCAKLCVVHRWKMFLGFLFLFECEDSLEVSACIVIPAVTMTNCDQTGC